MNNNSTFDGGFEIVTLEIECQEEGCTNMNILAHRGFWLDSEEANSMVAFGRGVSCEFGVELDVRDFQRKLVVSHDPAADDSVLFSEVLNLYEGSRLTMAVNVKSDGLSDQVYNLLRISSMDWFAFDMSAPETLRYARLRLPFFTRHSDIEPMPVLYDEACGIWLDSFHSSWFDGSVISAHIAAGKRVCVVSPELHGRDPFPVWELIKPLAAGLMLCTDLPREAHSYFNN